MTVLRRGRLWGRPLFFSLLFVAMVSLTAWAEPLSVTLPDRLAAREGELLLCEIAEIQGNPVVVSAASRAVVKPKNGALRREDVTEALVRMGLEGTTLRLRMPAVVQVAPENEFARHVRRISRWPWTLDVRTDGSPCGDFSGPRSLSPGSSAAVLRFRDARGIECLVPIRIRWLQPVLVTQRAMERGTRVGPGDVRIAMAERIGNREPVALTSGIGVTLSANLPVGAIMFEDDVKREPAVRRGQEVRIRVIRGELVVEARGEALETASVGEPVRVRNLESRTVVQGVVAAPGLVVVQKE